MSSNYCGIGTLVVDPETKDIGGKQATKIRFAVKAGSKKNEDRFVNMLCFGYDTETAARLRTGDRIFVSGPLEVETYISKKTKQKVLSDAMGFGSRINRVVHSPTFFAGAKTEAEAAPEAPATAGKGPLDDLDL